MSNHIGHLERVWDFTVQVLKQDIDKTLSNKESVFMKKKKDELVEKYRRTSFVMDITVQLIWLVLFIKQIQLWKSFMKKPISMQLSFTFNPEWGICSSYCQIWV